MSLLPVTGKNALSKSEFHERLSDSYKKTEEDTIGPPDMDGRTAWVYVKDGDTLYLLHADTPRHSVAEYLSLVERQGRVLDWTLRKSRKGKMTAVAYGPERQVIESFYLYLA